MGEGLMPEEIAGQVAKETSEPKTGYDNPEIDRLRSENQRGIEANYTAFWGLAPGEKIKAFHAKNFEGAIVKEKVGDWRTNNVRCGKNEETAYWPPIFEEVPRLAAFWDEFLGELKSDPKYGVKGHEDYTERVAAFGYVYGMMVHPFFDGNGQAFRNFYSSELCDVGFRNFYLPERSQRLRNVFKEQGMLRFESMVSEVTVDAFDQRDGNVHQKQSLAFLENLTRSSGMLKSFIETGKNYVGRGALPVYYRDLWEFQQAVLDVTKIFGEIAKDDSQLKMGD